MPVPRWRGVGSGLSGDTIVVSSPRRGKGAHHVARPSILNCWLPPFLKDQVNATALHGIFTPNLHKDAVVGWEGTVPRACGHKQHKWGAGRAIYRVPRTGCTVPFPHHWSSPRETKCWGLRLSLTMEGVGRASLPRASFSSCPFSWPNGDASLEIQKQSKWRRMCPHGQPAPRSCLSGGKWGREPHYDIRPASPLGHKWSGSLEHLVWPSSCLTPRKKRRPPALPPPPAPPAIHPSTGASERCCHVCECVYVCVRQLGVVPLFYFFFLSLFKQKYNVMSVVNQLLGSWPKTGGLKGIMRSRPSWGAMPTAAALRACACEGCFQSVGFGGCIYFPILVLLEFPRAEL